MKQHLSKLVIIALAGFLTQCSLRRDALTVSGASPDNGKPRPPIFLEYTINKTVDPGTPANVTIKGKPLTDVQQFRLRARLPSGVTLVSGALTAEGNNLAAGTQLSASFSVSSNNTGTYYIALDGSFTKDAQVVSDTISIPMVVGDGGTMQKPGVVKESGGEKIIEMPAK